MDSNPIASERVSGDVLELSERRGKSQPAASPDVVHAMAALVFSDDQQPDEILSEFAALVMSRGHRALGLIQRGHCSGPATRELFVTLLHTGDDVQIFQDLGSCAQGCKLDVNQLLFAGASISQSLTQDGADILIINRFGKLEKEGKGLLFLIDQALSAGVPVLIAVPEASLDDWMEFSGGLGVTLECSEACVTDWWDGFAAAALLPRSA
ncbi:MAG TPA: DUF2478 domain-containing protein [Afipia sp.]